MVTGRLTPSPKLILSLPPKPLMVMRCTSLPGIMKSDLLTAMVKLSSTLETRMVSADAVPPTMSVPSLSERETERRRRGSSASITG